MMERVTLEPKEIERLIAAHRQNPDDRAAFEDLRAIRLRLAVELGGVSDDDALAAMGGRSGASFNLLIAGPTKDEPPDAKERAAASHLAARAITGAAGPLLGTMLLCRPFDWEALPDPGAVPEKLREPLLRYTLRAPELFMQPGDAERFARFFAPWIVRLADCITSRETAEAWRPLSSAIATLINIIPLYFSAGDLRVAMSARGRILDAALRQAGFALDHPLPPAPGPLAKVRLGILQMQFQHHTETYTALSVFDHLDRNRFDITLFVLGSNQSDIERYCRSRADRFIVLPGDARQQAETIRAAAPDILFIGTNIAAVTHPIVVLACHKLARVQFTSLNSPVTTGIPAMTHYLLGAGPRSREVAQAGYTERLAMIEAPGMCFSKPMRAARSGETSHREAMGIGADATVFISGANFYKVIPELRRTWARMIARVPGSVLVLFPFGPSWSNEYANGPFLRDIYTSFAVEGLDAPRLVVMPPMASPSDIQDLLKVADVYVDSFPYAGATSIIDALEVGLPTIVVDSVQQRFGQAAALLRELGVPELIASDERGYVELAVSLGVDVGRRKRVAEEIREKMKGTPRFLNPRWYAGQIAPRLEQMLLDTA